jgi:hypothetical protein
LVGLALMIAAAKVLLIDVPSIWVLAPTEN